MIKKAVKAYNTNSGQWYAISDVQYPDKVTFEECADIESPLWDGLENVDPCQVPRSIKKHLIDLFHMSERCQEEVTMLNDEMSNCVTFFSMPRPTKQLECFVKIR